MPRPSGPGSVPPMAGVTRRRFIQTTAATGAAAALLPATRHVPAHGPRAGDLAARTRSYLEEQRKAGAGGGDPAFLTGTQLAAMLPRATSPAGRSPRRS